MVLRRRPKQYTKYSVLLWIKYSSLENLSLAHVLFPSKISTLGTGAKQAPNKACTLSTIRRPRLLSSHFYYFGAKLPSAGLCIDGNTTRIQQQRHADRCG